MQPNSPRVKQVMPLAKQLYAIGVSPSEYAMYYRELAELKAKGATK